jgi:hypothetical protein
MNLNKPQKTSLNIDDVSGSANPKFLLDAVNELLTYRTPKKIVDYIEAEKLKVIIGNPPYPSINT